MSRHETVTLTHPKWDREVEIDAGIAELIEAMWAADILTLESCENDQDGWTHIGLADVDDLAILLSAVGKPSEKPSSIFQHLADWDVGWSHPSRNRHGWRYEVSPAPLCDEWPPGEDEWPFEWSFSVLVEFPPEDIPAATDALREYVKATHEVVEAR